jgi:histidine triad (HIT) family protein
MRCPFCRDNWSRETLVLAESDSGYFIKNEDPVLRCSGLVIPKRHVASPFDLTDAEWSDTHFLLREAAVVLSDNAPEGYNIGWNVGQVAGQIVPHAHLHVIGRFSDEPFASQGIRHHLKQPANARPVT